MGQKRHCNSALLVDLQAVEEQIRNFGQTPSQLFKRRHVKRGPAPAPSTRPLLNAPTAMELVTVGQPNAKRSGCCLTCHTVLL